jgi:hypothetical protein
MLASSREFDKPALHEIRVKGTVDPAWASYWIGDLKVTHLPNGESLLTGQVDDQSALLGLLAQMRDLGLPLLSVTRTGDRSIAEENTDHGTDDE